MTFLFMTVHCRDGIDELRTRLIVAICNVERYLSVVELDMKLHCLVHLIDTIEHAGMGHARHACAALPSASTAMLPGHDADTLRFGRCHNGGCMHTQRHQIYS
jgi:hypothetical protein